MSVDSGRPLPASPEAVIAEALFRHEGIQVSRWRCLVRPGVPAVICHHWYIIKFVHTGAFYAHLHDGKIHVDSTRTILVAPRKPYTVTRQFGPDVTGSAIAIHPETMLKILGERGDFPTQILREEVTPRALLMQHLILRKIEENAPAAVITELILALVREAFRDPSPRPEQKGERATTRWDAVARAQAILAANYEKPVRLEDVARAVELSPYYLCREFRRTTGVSMHQYLNRLRLRAALEHVAEARLPLAEIAHHHGFSSHSHFAAAFRKEFRITPSRARGLATHKVADLRHTLGFRESAI